MKTTLLSQILLLIFSFSSFSQDNSKMMKLWEPLLNKKELAVYFIGIFDRLGVVIEETNEQFTVVHHADHFDLVEGVDAQKVDYIAHLKKENIANMVKHGSDDKIDSLESYKIMSVLFTPLTDGTLKNPIFKSSLNQKLLGIENHIHVNLISPDKKDTVSHTLFFINKEWIVVPGVHGSARRTFNLSQQDALDYQRKMFYAIKADTNKEWKKFKKWYVGWREGVSRT